MSSIVLYHTMPNAWCIVTDCLDGYMHDHVPELYEHWVADRFYIDNRDSGLYQNWFETEPFDYCA